MQLCSKWGLGHRTLHGGERVLLIEADEVEVVVNPYEITSAHNWHVISTLSVS